MIVPGGGLSPDGTKWVACKPGFFLHVRVLARLFRRLFLEGLSALHADGQLNVFGEMSHLGDPAAFENWLAPSRKTEWVVYAKPLILEGEASTLTVSLDVGFNSRSAFYEAFKGETGMTPKAYRNATPKSSL